MEGKAISIRLAEKVSLFLICKAERVGKEYKIEYRDPSNYEKILELIRDIIFIIFLAQLLTNFFFAIKTKEEGKIMKQSLILINMNLIIKKV